jgi:hypothetical protein
VLHADLGLLAGPERALRQLLGLPPFEAIATLRGPGAMAYAQSLRTVRGISVSTMENDRWLVKAPDHGAMSDALAQVDRPAERLRVEVDPTDA